METPRDPIAFILDEHDRQFEICDRLENFVGTLESEPSGQEAQSLLAFLTEDLPVHIDDEERDLFPMLASRGYNDQNLNIILEQLAAEHDNFHYIPALNEPTEDDNWEGFTGFVHEAAKEHFDNKFSGHKAYLCGPPPMIDAAIMTPGVTSC